MPSRVSNAGPVPPPRMLLGASLLLWGGITDHALIGLVAALLVEASHWTRIRWDFGEAAHLRAWRMSILILLVTGGIIWTNSSEPSALPQTLAWLPIVLLPLQFIQSYGMAGSMSLTTLSLYLRKRRTHALQHNLPFNDVRFNFGNIFLIATLVAAALGKFSTTRIFFPAILLLLIWYFHRNFSWKRRLAPLGAIFMLLPAAIVGLAGEQILGALYRGSIDMEPAGLSQKTSTSLGDLGEIKGSPAIRWRVLPVQGELPRLVRNAAYNQYARTHWYSRLPVDPTPDDAFQSVGMFEELPSFSVDETEFHIAARNSSAEFLEGIEATDSSLPRFTLRGAFPRKGLLPLSGNSISLIQPSLNLEINPFGTLLHDPEHSVVNATILTRDTISTGRPPWEDPHQPDKPFPDLRIPKDDHEAVKRLVAELELQDLPLDETIDRLRNHFREHFSYTRYLAHPKPRKGRERKSFVSLFLEESRQGHCEYFATATAFILRECGIPTRYATGFAVIEKDPETGIAYLRGNHAHAWTLAWDPQAEQWIDVDLTPPDWAGIETPRLPPWQSILDRWQIIRDDLVVWRTQPGRVTLLISILSVPFIGVAIFLFRRLWSSRQRLDSSFSEEIQRPEGRPTPLSQLELIAVDHLGPRPPGTPLAQWIAQLAPLLSDPSALKDAIRLHQKLRFDPEAEPKSLTPHLDQAVTLIDQQLRLLPEKGSVPNFKHSPGAS